MLVFSTITVITAPVTAGPEFGLRSNNYSHPGATHTSSPAVAASPVSDEVNAAAEPLTVRLGLGGYSPVSYLDRNKAEPGSPLHAAEHDGVTYFFTTDGQRRTFESNPEKYLPAYGGYCAFGCSVDSKFIPDPTSFEIIEGRTHLFLKNDEVDARALWNDADERELKRKARSFWRRAAVE